ncbi:MAG TPA: tRNA glutamyl-Q(34) synthetase GluQRS [Solimonas sp.]
MTAPAAAYRGRFAPTPSGPLHLGSLLTALASWLQARHHDGVWLLRIDDLDAARCPPGTDGLILRQLEAHGLTWDEPPLYQSRRHDAYADALDQLRRQATLYACDCTRRALKARLATGPDDSIYDGHCRERALAATPGHALRLRVDAGTITLDDAGLGPCRRDLQTDIGDFVVARGDGIPGYQLASVIDDRDLRIGEIVRGADLLGSSIRQRYLFDRMDWPAPAFRHLPVLTGADGRKLSKQNHAAPLADDPAGIADSLWRCLNWLNQVPPPELRRAGVDTLLGWARLHWNAATIPRVQALALEPMP